MELKAFKGMPHEFGGIDYTENSEVEGGEFAVEIGKSGNEYIFDKNSSEGERLSKEYKKLDKNGRLTEDDPLALETFNQIARKEALKHAQRSVNEKGVDPFRNMYEQGGQAANGGVKYATGGSFGPFEGFKNGGAKPIYGYYANGGGKSYTDKIKEAEDNLNQYLGNPMNKAFDDFSNELQNNPRLRGDDMYLDPYRHGIAGYYTADAMRKKMPDWMPESVANKLAIAGSTIAGVGHEFASPSTDRMGLVDALTEAGQDAYNNYVGAKMIEDVLFDREAKQLMLDKIKREETYPGVVISDSDPYSLPKDVNDAVDNGLTFDQIMELEKKGLVDLTDLKKFQDGGGKKEEDEVGVTGVAVTPTGAAYSSNQMSLDNRSVGSTDYGIIPANLEQYFYTLLGGNKQFTEKDMTPEEYKALVRAYNNRKESNTLGYSDYDRVGSTDIDKASMLSKFSNEPDIVRTLIGKADVKDGYLTSDYNFGNTPLFEILKNPKKRSVENVMAWLHNNSPLVDSEAMAKKDAIKIKMPKN